MHRKIMSMTIALILMLSISMSLSISVQAVQIPTYLLVHAEPNPVGVGQNLYISLFMSKPIPTTSGQLYRGLTVTIVRPDGTNETLGPYTADQTGGVGGIAFSPSVTGNYTVQGFYPGQTLVNSNDTLAAARSDPVTVSVQDNPVGGYNAPPLPTEYWSRPIIATNYMWAHLAGSWWGAGRPSFTDTGGYDAEGNTNYYSTAPNTGHIMWVKPTAFGGLVGEPILADQESQYTSTSILYRHFEPIILNGVIFYTEYPSIPNARPGWRAVDLRTGETLWTKNTTDLLSFASVLKFHTVQEYGTLPLLWATNPSGSLVYSLYDPFSGTFIANITDAAPLAGALTRTNSFLMHFNASSGFDSQGDVLSHYITSGNLTMWNSTRCLAPTSTSTIRPSGNINFTRGIQWSVVVPTNISGQAISPNLSISARTNEVILLRSAPTYITQTGRAYTVEAGFDTLTGQLLWGPVNRTVPEFADISVIGAADGYYVTHDKDTLRAWGYSLMTGEQLWGPLQLEGSALSHLERGGALGYGKAFIWDFGGHVTAINLETGKVDWVFSRGSAGYENPYGVYPIWHFGSHSMADGKLFLAEGHMYDPPLFPNAKRLALNVTDGSVVWSILSFAGRAPGAIADGMLVQWNSYDKQIYTFGKGPTATTVAASPKSSVQGTNVVIEGFVADISAGTKDADRTARFPNGVAAVSDDSMTPWMEYVYMQQPKPTNVTGVPVVLSVLDANGNTRTIGTTTSDSNGFFSFDWEPDIPGKFTLVASFAGSESYWPSQATTAFAVETAPDATSEPTTTPPSVSEMYFIPSVAAIILAIAIVGVVLALLLLRKHP